MSKAIILCLISYISGILAFGVLDASTLGFVCIVMLLAIATKRVIFSAKVSGFAPLLCGFFILGAVYTSFVHSYNTDAIRKVDCERTKMICRIIGVIDKDNEFYDSYEAEVHTLKVKDDTKQLTQREKVRLSLKKYDQRRKITPYKYGDIIEVDGTVSLLDKPYNEGEANYAKIAYADKIFYELTGEYDNSKHISYDINYYDLRDLAQIARGHFIGIIDKHFKTDDAALLKGILLSEKSYNDEYYNRLSDSGMMHITVASGLHAGCVFAMITWLCFALRIRKKYTYTIAALCLFAYSFLQGMTPSIMRAATMLCFYMLSELVSRDYDKEHILYITAFLMLFINPYMIYDVGFILSFASVLGIAIFKDIIDEHIISVVGIRRLSSLISVSLSVQILLFPLLAYYFNKVSVYSLLANLVIVPILTIVLVLGLILLCIGTFGNVLPSCIAFVLGIFLKYINGVIRITTALPFSHIDIFSMKLSTIIIYYLALMAIYCYYTKGIRKYNFIPALSCGVLIFFVLLNTIYTSMFLRVSFINVGQGDAAVIKIPYGKTVLIDGGGSSPKSKTDLGERILVPYLRRNGVNTIDYVILSHYDKDHAQGVAAAIRLMKVKNLVLPYRDEKDFKEYRKIIEELATQKQINVLYFKEGDCFNLGSASFEMLAPDEQNATNRAMSENNKSLVTRMQYGKTSFLFTGDVEKAAIGKLVHYGDELRSDVLKVAHHGSAESNLTKFIRTIAPKYAVISVGADNVYSLPTDTTLDLLERERITTFRTDKSGTISFYVNKQKIKWIDTFY